MKIQVYKSELDDFVEMEAIGKVLMLNDHFYSLTKGKEYYIIKKELLNLVRIVDDTDEDYLYPLQDKYGNYVFELKEVYDEKVREIFK